MAQLEEVATLFGRNTIAEDGELFAMGDDDSENGGGADAQDLFPSAPEPEPEPAQKPAPTLLGVGLKKKKVAGKNILEETEAEEAEADASALSAADVSAEVGGLDEAELASISRRMTGSTYACGINRPF
eukprot:COSAG05_NODE_11_length_38500_cov_831.349861_5_plen_129_part_00